MEDKIDLVVPAKSKKIDSINDPICEEFVCMLKKSKNIDTFCLMGNSYGVQFFRELTPLVKSLLSVSKLLLNDIFTSRTDEILDSIELISEMFKDKNVALLNMSDNAVCPDGCQKLEGFFKFNKELKYLYLNHSALSQAGTKTICDFLLENQIQLLTF